MDAKAIEKRFFAAQKLLASQSISKESLDALRTLLAGIHPKIDLHLNAAGKAAAHLDKFASGDVIALTVESIPQDSEENKKKKKALLLFLKYWKDLKGEVARAQKEFEKTHGQEGGMQSALGNILSAAKGPLGIITLIAVGVAALQLSSVEIRIKNNGCDTIYPVVSFPVRLPGLTLPDQPIPSGSEGIAKLPPLTLIVDGTKPGTISMTGFGISYNFTLGTSGITLSFDDQRLNGNITTLVLGNNKKHDLVVTCK